MVSADHSNHILTSLKESSLSGRALRREAMLLLSALDGYDWCGVYRLDIDALELDAFVGDPTEHTRIPVGVGVCGTAVAMDQNQVVEDVRKLQNYLSCSIDTRSEIVVLIRRDGDILGQIDIDGHTLGAFDSSDERLLESVGEILASRWE